jgi:hypothetical protein
MPKKTTAKTTPKKKSTPKKPQLATATAAASAPKSTEAQKPRKLAAPKYHSFRLQKRIPSTDPRVPGSFSLFLGALKVLKTHWRLFMGIVIIYGLLNAIFVQGLTSGNSLGDLKGSVQNIVGGHFGGVSSGFTIMLFLLGASNDHANNPAGGGYQFILMIIVSLALIWALRQVHAGGKITVRDAYYQGMAPLVPFVVVLGAIGLQLLPMVAGVGVYSLVMSTGVAVSGVEKFLWLLVLVIPTLVSLYMMTSSIFALYIVTLPKMTPLKALRTARELVQQRRWIVLRKVVFLPLALLVFSTLLMLVTILVVSPLAIVMFFILTTTGIAIIHSYMYSLYRSLL